MNILAFDIETIPDTDGGRKIYGLEGLNDDEVATAMFNKRREKVAVCQKIMQDEGVIVQPYWRTLTNYSKANLGGAGHHITFEHRPQDLYWKKA